MTRVIAGAIVAVPILAFLWLCIKTYGPKNFVGFVLLVVGGTVVLFGFVAMGCYALTGNLKGVGL